MKNILIDFQFFTDFDESFVTQTLFQWNPMTHLKEFELSKASQLSIVAVNVVIQVWINIFEWIIKF